MKIETRNNGNEDHTVIIADDGKTFKRIVSDEIVGNEVWLGYSYYIGGVLQDPPHLDVPEDFEEVDAPKEEEEDNIEQEEIIQE